MWRNLEDGTKYQRDEKSGEKVRKLRVWSRKFNIQLSGILGREKRKNGKGKITDELINEKISELKDHMSGVKKSSVYPRQWMKTQPKTIDY